jgi:hypothetical protein
MKTWAPKSELSTIFWWIEALWCQIWLFHSSQIVFKLGIQLLNFETAVCLNPCKNCKSENEANMGSRYTRGVNIHGDLSCSLWTLLSDQANGTNRSQTQCVKNSSTVGMKHIRKHLIKWQAVLGSLYKLRFRVTTGASTENNSQLKAISGQPRSKFPDLHRQYWRYSMIKILST